MFQVRNTKYEIRNSLLILCALCVLCVLCGVILTGCDQTSAQRIEAVKTIVNQASSVNQSIDASVADLNLAIASCKAALADPNIPAEWRSQIEVTMLKAQAKLDSLLAQKQKATALLDTYQQLLAGIDSNTATLQTELDLYGRGATAIAPVVGGKTGGVLYLAGLLIPLAGGLVASVIKNLKQGKQVAAQNEQVAAQNEQINDGKAILTDIVVSVGKLLDPKTNDGVIPPDKIEEAKFILQDNQSGYTQDAVDAIKDPMQNTAPES